jgi:hypothetical protein
MEASYKQVYDAISKECVLELLLPEDKNFIQKTRDFQQQIKALDQMMNIDEKHIRTVYFLSTEMTQAVVHNGIFDKDVFVNCVKLFIKNNKLYLMSQNLVNHDKIGRIVMKFDEVNSAFDSDNTVEELNHRYKFKLKNAPMAKAGISVGVLDLARRSLNKLLYNFEVVGDNLSVFSIICTIDIAD